jgi:prepilin-type N-terminal cleavage/methylation domain-containing protein
MATHSRRESPRGFTLIELLVVVAIMGLLIAILLPSLNKARAQARTTLCATRIGQLTKSLFLYAEDFEERFPFHIVYGLQPAWGGGGYGGVDDLDPNEDWIASKQDMPHIFLSDQADWPSLGVDCPRSGTLFPYTRFAELYACPEFVRRTSNGLSGIEFFHTTAGDQRAFNYTRGPWCRKPNFQLPPDLKIEFNGPILTASKVYAPATAFLLLDEAWYANVGRGRTAPAGLYLAADPVWDLCSSQGIYHGAPILGDAWFKNGTPQYRRNIGVKRGSVSCYDGHVDLERDPCPLVDSNTARPDIFVMVFSGSTAMLHMIERMAYSLLGQTIDL